MPKGSRSVGGLDEIAVSLYPGGMTVRDIGYHLQRTYGTELSRETISKITDGALEEVRECRYTLRQKRLDRQLKQEGYHIMFVRITRIPKYKHVYKCVKNCPRTV